jgi:predicted  nucleic acid-binding Zn-ribbon protein
MEKSAAELFNEETEHQKEENLAHDSLDLVEREIVHLRNQIDELRTKIRNLENEARDWKKVMRTKKYLASKARTEGWAARNSGL